MSDALLEGILRVLGVSGETAGTAFLTHDGLAVTCAHVVKGPGEPVELVRLATGERLRGTVRADTWSAAADVAILDLEHQAQSGWLPLGSAGSAEGGTFRTHGFPLLKATEGMPGECAVLPGRTTENGWPVLALRSQEITRGFSGAPVWDATLGVVVGMVTSIAGRDPDRRNRSTAFMIPVDTIRQLCPQLGLGEETPYRVDDIAAMDAMALGVHRAVDPDERSAYDGRVGTTVLPGFVGRGHDKALRQILSGVRADGPAGRTMVFLVGDSCTGKTRSALEGVCGELRGWSLYAPRDAGELVDLLRDWPRRCNAEGGGAVIWLDEIFRYLGAKNGEQAARLLLDLLHNPAAPGPFAIIGTMWDPQWRELAYQEQPVRGFTDDFAGTARLLRVSRTVWLEGEDLVYSDDFGKRVVVVGVPLVCRLNVPQTFETSERSTAAELAFRGDRQWGLILTSMSETDARLTQFLAGGPQLLDWYHYHCVPKASDPDMSVAAAAVVTAAVQATLLGWKNRLSSKVLEEAAEGYLRQADLPTSPGWFQAALESACPTTPEGHRRLRLFVPTGVRPLTEGRCTEGRGPFAVADYLVQHARPPCRHKATERPCRCRLPPPELWDALVKPKMSQIDENDAWRIAQAATDRHLLPSAIAVVEKLATSAGDRAAMLTLSEFATQAGERHLATMWREAARAGVSDSRVGRPSLTDNPDEVDSLVLEAIRSRDPDHMRRIADALCQTNNDIADFVRRFAANYAARSTLGSIERLLLLDPSDADALDLAVASWRHLVDTGGLGAPRRLWEKQLLRSPLTLAFYEQSLSAVSETASILVVCLHRAHRTEAAEQVDRQATAAGAQVTLNDEAEALERSGHIAEAERVLRATSETDPKAAHQLAALLARLGRIPEATEVWWSLVERGDIRSAHILAAHYTRFGELNRVEQVWRTSLEAGSSPGAEATPDSSAMGELLGFLQDNGRSAEAARLSRYGIFPGGATANCAVPAPPRDDRSAAPRRGDARRRARYYRAQKLRQARETLTDIERAHHAGDLPSSPPRSDAVQLVLRYLVAVVILASAASRQLGLITFEPPIDWSHLAGNVMLIVVAISIAGIDAVLWAASKRAVFRLRWRRPYDRIARDVADLYAHSPLAGTAFLIIAVPTNVLVLLGWSAINDVLTVRWWLPGSLVAAAVAAATVAINHRFPSWRWHAGRVDGPS